MMMQFLFFFFSSRRRHTRFDCDWSSDVCSSDLVNLGLENGSAVITVEDQGRGIPAGAREKVWQPYWRLPRERESAGGGGGGGPGGGEGVGTTARGPGGRGGGAAGGAPLPGGAARGPPPRPPRGPP